MTCDTCRELLSQGLDLCVRARKLDSQEMMGKPVTGGRVGVPRKGERKCPDCGGTGVDPEFGYRLMGGCERCSSTGVVPLPSDDRRA